MLPRGLTSLLDSGKNKAIAAAEPACCCCCFWNPRKTTFFHSCCCCCCSRMALKEEPSPKYTSCGRNVPSEILQKASCWCGKLYYNQFFTLLLLLLLDSLPLLLPRPLLWLLLQLPAAKHHGPKGRTKSKMYVSRGRNVPSEILQKACRCYCHGRRSGCCRSSRQQKTRPYVQNVRFLLLLLLLESLLPLLLPRLLLWLLLQLPAAKHHEASAIAFGSFICKWVFHVWVIKRTSKDNEKS